MPPGKPLIAYICIYQYLVKVLKLAYIVSVRHWRGLHERNDSRKAEVC